MRKILLCLCMLIAATMFVASPALAGEGGEGHAKPKAEKKAEGEKPEDKKKGKEKSPFDVTDGPQNSFYLKLDPMIMPVLGQNNVQETVSMIVALQISEQKNIEEVSHLVPKIKDAYMSALYGNLNKAAYRNGQFLDVNKLKSKLILVTESFANKKIIQDVLIQGVSQRRFN
jgi:flagellar basal body-associated protein FliL